MRDNEKDFRSLRDFGSLIHDEKAVADLRRRLRLDPSQLRRFRCAFYKRGLSTDEALNEIAPGRREKVRAAFLFHPLALEARHDSQLDGSTKLIFRTAQGKLLEAVMLRIASGRTSLCVSSQVGCAARCRFCATGQMGSAVNLNYGEILDQVVQANQLLRQEARSIRNLVFMGMGEPFHNEQELYRALDVLLSPDCFNFSPLKVAVSTVGIPQAIVRFARRYPQVRLALSLHSARQEVRETLIPLARRHSLEGLRCALAEAVTYLHAPIMIEYLLLDGINDSKSDLDALLDFLSNLPVHINLIPYNPIPDAPELRATSAERRRQFAEALRAEHFKVTIRHSLGADIAAACGQLARQSKRDACST